MGAHLKRGLFLIMLVHISIITWGQQANKQVAVFVYCDKTVTTPINALRAKLTSSLVNEGASSYVVLDRTEEILSALKSEYKYQSGGLVRDDQLMSIGEHLGVNYLCVVNITYYSADCQFFFECKLVNIESRQIEKQSFFPDDNSVVSSLSPQEQVRVAGNLSRAFTIKSNSLRVGDIYYDDSNNPVYVKGNLMRIGYIDQTGNHGFAFVVLPEPYSYPVDCYSSDCELQVPYISQLKLLYENKDILDLDAEYWSADYEGDIPREFERDRRVYYEDHLHKSFNFHDGAIRTRRSSYRYTPPTKRGKAVTVSWIQGYTKKSKADKIQCINILFF